MKRFTLKDLSEGIQSRNVLAETNRLVEKWTKTGLLRGLDGEKRNNMARLLENQAAEVVRTLTESNGLSTGGGATTSSGQIQGFSNIAFPIVRRVFGGLIANELVSIQPMSLPSGLIFYLDYTYGSNQGGDAGSTLSNAAVNDTYQRGNSIYTNPSGAGIRSGSLAAGGMYDLVGTGFSKVHSQSLAVSGCDSNAGRSALGGGGTPTVFIGAWTGAAEAWSSGSAVLSDTMFTGTNARFCAFDPTVENDLRDNNLDLCYVHMHVAQLTGAVGLSKGDLSAVDQIAITGFAGSGGTQAWGEKYQAGAGVLNLRRHNKRGTFDATALTFAPDPFNGTHIQFAVRLSNGGATPTVGATTAVSMAIADALTVDASSGATLTVPSFETDFGSTPTYAIPEIDIKIAAIAITTTTRKLRARWTPELAQDLNAYQSLDAEVELTQILSEQIALEVDREILQDLVVQGNAANLYWSRAPGKFVNKTSGAAVDMANSLSSGPRFTGTVIDWYQTLIETIIDVSNTIHRKTLRGAGNFIVTSPDVSTILEASVSYKPKYSLDGDGQVGQPMAIGCEMIGNLSNRFTVYKDPYFPRNKILVGYKGKGALESGMVYAPYVPLIVTPTIFNPDDFSPRRGVMTRYGKKVIRSDYYGTVTVLDMNII
jgi:hypothetical protein